MRTYLVHKVGRTKWQLAVYFDDNGLGTTALHTYATRKAALIVARLLMERSDKLLVRP